MIEAPLASITSNLILEIAKNLIADKTRKEEFDTNTDRKTSLPSENLPQNDVDPRDYLEGEEEEEEDNPKEPSHILEETSSPRITYAYETYASKAPPRSQKSGVPKEFLIFRLLWATFVCFVLLICMAIFATLPTNAAFILCSIILGACTGTTLLIFLKPKVLTTVTGIVIGFSVSDLSSAASLLSSIRLQVTQISVELNLIAGGEVGTSPPGYITISSWIFIFLFGLIPAYAYLDNKHSQG